jgi:hypoxia up-regulated 1
VPRIQELLQNYFGEGKELGVHLNGDEAMCFGSAFIASNSSASFKVRKVYLTQHPSQAFSIRISPANASRVPMDEQSEETVASVVGEGD